MDATKFDQWVRWVGHPTSRRSIVAAIATAGLATVSGSGIPEAAAKSKKKCKNGKTKCGGVCVDTQTDANHCGSCPQTCASTETCQGGQCVSPGACPSGQIDCGAGCVTGDCCAHADCPGAGCFGLGGTLGGTCQKCRYGSEDCGGAMCLDHSCPCTKDGACLVCNSGDHLCGDKCVSSSTCCPDDCPDTTFTCVGAINQFCVCQQGLRLCSGGGCKQCCQAADCGTPPTPCQGYACTFGTCELFNDPDCSFCPGGYCLGGSCYDTYPACCPGNC